MTKNSYTHSEIVLPYEEGNRLFLDARSCCMTCEHAHWHVAPHFVGGKYGSDNPDIVYASIFCKHNNVCGEYAASEEQMVLIPVRMEEEK